MISKLIYKFAEAISIYIFFGVIEALMTALVDWYSMPIIRNLPMTSAVVGAAIVTGAVTATYRPTFIVGTLYIALQWLYGSKLKDSSPSLWAAMISLVTGGSASAGTLFGCTSWCAAGKPGASTIPQIAASVETMCARCPLLAAAAFVLVAIISVSCGRAGRRGRRRSSHSSDPESAPARTRGDKARILDDYGHGDGSSDDGYDF